MIPEFTNAVITGEVGEFKVVETSFGYHIIKVTGKKSLSKKVKMAICDKKMTFSQETYDKAYNEASKFASLTKDSSKFEKNTTDMGLQVNHSGPVRIMDAGLQGINGSRTAIQWAFNKETEVGDVSTIFAYEDKICVAVLKEIKEKGISSLEDVKDFIKPLVIRDLKAKQIMDKFKTAGSDLYAFAATNNTVVDTFPQFSFGSYSLPKYGPEPSVQGRIPALKLNKISGPFKGDQGVYFVIVDSKTDPMPVTDNYKSLIQQGQMMMQQRISGYDRFGEAYNAIEDKADVKDYRHFFQ
jgi:hypothetical protein